MQTVYIGNTLVNDIFLGSRRIDDAFREDSRGYSIPPVTDGLEVYLTTYATQSYNSGSTTWTDLSGNSRNFSLSNPSYWQSGSYNGLYLGISGSVYSTATASFSNGLPWTFNTTGSAFVVLKKRPNLVANNYGAWLSFNDGTNTNNDFTNYQRHGISNNTNTPAYAFVYTNGSANLTTNVENTQDGLFHLVYEGWNSGASKAFIGIDTNATGSGTMDTFINTGSIRLSIGTNARLNQSDNANSAFYEIALYSRKLQGQELEDVKNYFINRYGIV